MLLTLYYRCLLKPGTVTHCYYFILSACSDLCFARVISTATSTLDLTEPDDPELRVMQIRFMESHLIELNVYDKMCTIGFVIFVCYCVPYLMLGRPFCPVIPVGLDPDTYDAPIYLTFDDIASLFKISSLMCVILTFLL